MAFERTVQGSPESRADAAQEHERKRQAAADLDAELQAEDEWLDSVLKETFPASDPVPIRHHDVPPRS